MHGTGHVAGMPGGMWMKELDYAKVGARICQTRKAKGWSREELAKRCGISTHYMGHIDRGSRKMSLNTFTSLCRELEADADVLLWGMMQPSEAVIHDLWKQPEKKDSDSYAMYIRIVKSVADIMGGYEKQEPGGEAEDQDVGMGQ